MFAKPAGLFIWITVLAVVMLIQALYDYEYIYVCSFIYEHMKIILFVKDWILYSI